MFYYCCLRCLVLFLYLVLLYQSTSYNQRLHESRGSARNGSLDDFQGITFNLQQCIFESGFWKFAWTSCLCTWQSCMWLASYLLFFTCELHSWPLSGEQRSLTTFYALVFSVLFAMSYFPMMYTQIICTLCLMLATLCHIFFLSLCF